jgi:hypothetical protein
VRAILNSMPPWILGPLFVLAFVAATLCVFWCVLRWGSALRNREYNATLGNFVSVVQALFGLTLALVIVTLFQNYRSTQTGIRSEAITLAELARLGTAFPKPVDTALRNEIVTFIHDVRTVEWDLLREGRTSARVWGDIGAMYATLKEYEPEASSARAFYSQALSRLDNLVTQRRDTLAAITEPIPGILQVLLLLAAVVILVLPMFLVTVSTRFQAAKVAAMVTVIATALFAATVLDAPFSRALPISKTPYRIVDFERLAGP